MDKYGLFDIIGPVMIGPSSSHTAGAVKIGYMARKIFGYEPSRVEFLLHGSFAKTYKGHGTDVALLSGVMGFKPDDERIRDAFKLADEKNISYDFGPIDLGDAHPNTVKINLYDHDGHKVEVTGASIGGGKIKIFKINSFDVEFDGEYATLITKHFDKPGVIASVTGILSKYKVNVAFMKVFRHIKGEKARLILEVDNHIPAYVVDEIDEIEAVVDVTFVEKLDL